MNESTLVPREEMSDLDWLARNMHDWPYELQTHCYVMTSSGGKKELGASACSPFFSKFTKDQWLARRAELQNKPAWGSVGGDINFISQHEDGQWIGHSEKPDEGDDCFECDCIISLFGYGEVLGEWRDTLEKRPEQTIADICEGVTSENRHEEIFESFVSAEDAATAKMHDPVSNPSHYASGGIECIEAIKASMSHEAFLGYLKGNVQKYMWRYEKKVNPAEDLKKARWYLDKLIEEQK